MVENAVIPTNRQRVLALLKLLSPLAALGALHVGAWAYQTHVAPLALCDQLTGMRLAILSVALILLGFAFTLWRAGVRVWRAGRFPPPGMPVLFRTQVRVGWWAKADAASYLLLGGLFAAALALLLHYFVFSEVGLYLLGLRRCEP